MKVYILELKDDGTNYKSFVTDEIIVYYLKSSTISSKNFYEKTWTLSSIKRIDKHLKKQ